ncbi:leptin-like [Platichthys flesus]|uniref:leptin-like n=1 Tax=Platichthys flesus TaxID=8260 RepID=UPI002DB6D489|nr:leptin-like [Platichthys flesus]XP_062246281.1 leptin-like [Platichthys flesus]
MDYTLALLFSLLQVLSVCSAAPVKTEVEMMKSRVKWMAEQLVDRLDKDFKYPASLTPADHLNGASSIVTVLDGFNSRISDTFHRVPRVKAEISSLTGYVDQWRRGHCSEWRPNPPMPETRLQSPKEFIHTASIEALMRVKEFLNLLLRNLDQLETC